jgi:lambda family phage tail tape measure protein
VASIQAQIEIILKGSSEIDKLQTRLEGIENTASRIQGQFEAGMVGRSSNIKTYIAALAEISKAASAAKDEIAGLQSNNNEIKKRIVLESQLRREKSRTDRLSRAFTLETKGLDQTTGTLKSVKQQFDAISSALGKAFKLKDIQIISQLRNELSALVEDQREWNRALAGTKNTGVNSDLLKEQSSAYARQIELLRERAQVLEGNEAILRKLNAAENNLVKGRTKEGTFLGFADPRLGREQLKNVEDLIQAEEKLAGARQKAAAEREKQHAEELKKINDLQEKIASFKPISLRAAEEYSLLSGLTTLALPPGNPRLPAVRGGARARSAAELGPLERLGGSRTKEEADAALRHVEERAAKTGKAIREAFDFENIFESLTAPDQLSSLEAVDKTLRNLANTIKKTGEDTKSQEIIQERINLLEEEAQKLLQRAKSLDVEEGLLLKIAQAQRGLGEQRKKTDALVDPKDITILDLQLKGIKSIIDAEDRLASERRKNALEEVKANKERIKALFDIAKSSLRLGGQAAGATIDAFTFGRGSQTIRGARNAAIRGGVGLGALGLGKAATAASSAAFFTTADVMSRTGMQAFSSDTIVEKGVIQLAGRVGSAINDALGGVPEIIGQMLSALGNIPTSLGIAAAAALAFAPAMKTAGEAVFMAGQKFGKSKFGENIKLTLNQQTNLFESVINKASEMNMVLDTSRSGLDAIGRKIQTLPALPAAGQTTFSGELRRGRGGAFIGGGAREIANPEFLVAATGRIAERTNEAAEASLMFAEGLGQAVIEAKTIADYLAQANKLRGAGESKTQKFIRETRERGRLIQANQTSAEIARERSALLLGGQYPLSQVPARGELFPGGRTETAQPDYRQMLNTKALVSQRQKEILQEMSKQQGFAATLGQLERRTLNTKNHSLKAQKQENEELELSIKIIKERNKELRQRPVAAMAPEERIAAGVLDPASLAASRRRRVAAGRKFQESRSNAISEGLIGGAFPLLFGQGVGASVLGGAGGALGGFAGGGLGFGLSLVGTALGTAFDTLNQAAQDTGKSLKYPIEGFEKLKEAGLFASRQQEYYISKLIESGRASQAAGEIQAEIIKKIGVEGVEDLTRLGDASTKLGKAWADFYLKLQAALAGPMAGLLNWLSSVLNVINKETESRNLASSVEKRLGGKDLKEFRDRQQAIELQLGSSGMSTLRDIGFNVGISPEEASKRRLALAKEFESRAAKQTGPEAKLTPEQEQAVLDKSIEVAEKVRALRQQSIDSERSQQDLRLNIEDTVYGFRKRAKDMEREAVQFRLSVEDRIFAKRQEAEQQAIENDRRRQQNSIETFDLRLQQASAGLDPVAESVVNAAREYLKIKSEGEANIQQKQKQLALELQQIDREASRYKLEIEDRVYQMSIQREEFSRDVSRSKIQIERSIFDLGIKLEDHRLAMAKRRYELAIEEGNVLQAAQIAKTEGLAVPSTGRNYANIGGFMNGRQMLHGIPGFAGRDSSHATPKNIHYHFAGKNPIETKAVAEYLKGLGYQITEFSGLGQRVGDHSKGSQHYKGNAFDIPGSSMEGRGGMADIIAGQKRVHALILDFLGAAKQRVPTVSAIPGRDPVAPTLPSMPSFPSAPGQVNIGGLLAQDEQIKKRILSLKKEENKLDEDQIRIERERSFFLMQQQILSPLYQEQQKNRELEFEIQQRRERNRLLMEGVRPEIVDGKLRILEIERTLNSVLQGLETTTNELIRQQLEKLKLNPKLVDASFELTEATLANLVATTEDVKKQEELRKKLQEILDLKNRSKKRAEDEAGGAIGGAREIAKKQAKPGQKIKDFIASATTELNDLEAVAVRVSQGIGDAVGNSLAQGISGLIEGTTTAQQVFSDFLKQVGQILVQEGTKMIGMYIAIGIAKIFAGLSSGAPDSSKFGLNTPDMQKYAPLANGGYFANGVAAFANGGMFSNSIVSSPTLFKFADGGSMRTGVMGEAGPEAIMPLSRGSDGRLGVDANGLREAMSANGAGSNTPALNMTFETTTINGVEYVSREQLEAAMRATRRQAAKDGAKQGMSMTLDRLQQSPKTRSRVGLR